MTKVEKLMSGIEDSYALQRELEELMKITLNPIEDEDELLAELENLKEEELIQPYVKINNDMERLQKVNAPKNPIKASEEEEAELRALELAFQ